MKALDHVIETYPGSVLDNYPDQMKHKAIEELADLRRRLDIACHIKADDAVGFDWAVLDEISELRERESERRAEDAAKELRELEPKE